MKAESVARNLAADKERKRKAEEKKKKDLEEWEAKQKTKENAA